MFKISININIGKRCLYLFLGVVLSIFPLIFSTSSKAAELYEKAQIDNNGQLHVVTTDNRDILPSKREFKLRGELKKQVAFSHPIISEDKTMVGWLAEYPNCCTSYPIPLELVIYRNGKIVRIFNENELPIWTWKFAAKGTQVGFHQETVHGGGGLHYELREIISGRLIQRYEGEPAPDAPAWVQDLKPKVILQPEEE